MNPCYILIIFLLYLFCYQQKSFLDLFSFLVRNLGVGDSGPYILCWLCKHPKFDYNILNNLFDVKISKAFQTTAYQSVQWPDTDAHHYQETNEQHWARVHSHHE